MVSKVFELADCSSSALYYFTNSVSEEENLRNNAKDLNKQSSRTTQACTMILVFTHR